MKYVKHAHAGAMDPFGETFFEASERAMVAALLVNRPFGADEWSRWLRL